MCDLSLIEKTELNNLNLLLVNGLVPVGSKYEGVENSSLISGNTGSIMPLAYTGSQFFKNLKVGDHFKVHASGVISAPAGEEVTLFLTATLPGAPTVILSNSGLVTTQAATGAQQWNYDCDLVVREGGIASGGLFNYSTVAGVDASRSFGALTVWPDPSLEFELRLIATATALNIYTRNLSITKLN